MNCSTPARIAGTIAMLALVGIAAPRALAQDTYKPTTQPSTEAKKPAAPKHDFSVEGQYVEACSCKAPCACELTGDVMMTCKGVGAIEISKGSYNGVDLSGAKIAYAMAAGKWVDIYVDAKDPKQGEAAKALASAAYADFGQIQDVKDAKIDVKRDGYAYTVNVDGGKTISFSTEPVMGADKKTPVAHENVSNNFNRTFLQGKSVACSYHGAGDKSFTVDKGRNAYFNDKMKASGQL
jgi:hypothetical protein